MENHHGRGVMLDRGIWAEHEDATRAASKQVLGSLTHILDSSAGLQACHHIRLELYISS